MKKLFAALVSLTLLCSCGKADTAETEATVSVTETTTAQTEQAMETTSQVTEETNPKPDGVYYPPVSEREVGYVFPENESCTLTFYTKTGLSVTVSLYPDGYVSMTSGGNTFIEEVSPEACQKLISDIA